MLVLRRMLESVSRGLLKNITRLLKGCSRIMQRLLNVYDSHRSMGPWVHGARGPRAQGLVGRTVDSKRLPKDY